VVAWLGVALGAPAMPSLVGAQAPGKLRRIGWLTGGSPGSHAKLLDAFRDALREHGWIEGRNIALEVRWAEGDLRRLPALAEELARLKPDVILTAAQPVNLAMKNATSSIPIVMATGADPVGGGLVASLARPGGNVTGLSGFYEVMPVKMIELAAAVVPPRARVALFVDAKSPFARGEYRDAVERAVKTFGLRADYFLAGTPEELGGAWSAVAKERPAVVIALPGSMFFALGDRIVKSAAELKLPLIGPFEEWADAGALISYAVSLIESYRRAASYVDKILRGAKPADLPIEQPTRLSLAVNLKTAKALGVAIPPAILARADRVIG
jgi:putative tryptophan/tyrosine transport system substrate-binding protein